MNSGNDNPSKNIYADAVNQDSNTGDQVNSNASTKSTSNMLPSIGSINGPVVLFYGPNSVGKTASLLRLLHYVTNMKECSYAFEGFRDDEVFKTAKQNFEQALLNFRQRPPRTTEFDFLLLNITHRGKPLFKLLEAPGEHFFKQDMPEDTSYPTYLNQIYNSDNKKIFVVFISDDMFTSLSHKEHYSKKVAELINMHMQPNRDRLIVLFNKIDNNKELFSGGRVNEKAVMDKIYSTSDFQAMVNAMRTNRGLREVLFVPYYSGNFNENSSQWSMSENFYPEILWSAINRQLIKRWLWF